MMELQDPFSFHESFEKLTSKRMPLQEMYMSFDVTYENHVGIFMAEL